MEERLRKQRFVKLSNVEDISAYNFGEYYSSGSKWVNLGQNNDWANYLRTLYLNSPTHQEIIDGTINLSTGEGVIVEQPEQNPISNKWINDNFPKKVVKKLLSDLITFGFCVVEVYNGEIYEYSEAIKWRYDQMDEYGNINYAWFSNDWTSYMQKRNRPVKLPLYKQGTEEPISVIFCQLDKKSFDYYSPVPYNGGINYISLECEISKYHLNNINNGLFPSFMVNFIGAEWSNEQMDSIERDINTKFGGSGVGRAMVNFSTDKDSMPTLTTIDQPTISDTYNFLSEECSRKILIAHGVTSPLLFGIRAETGFGNNAEEMATAFNLFYSSKLVHYQNYILEMIETLMHGELLYAPIKFKTYNPFNTTESDVQMAKYEPITEVNSQEMLNKIDENKIKIDGNYFLLKESIYDGNIKEDCFYKFVKSSKNENIINKKFEILDSKGYLMKGSDIVKNTKDYYFMERKYKKNN